jgi:hypothetical protein
MTASPLSNASEDSRPIIVVAEREPVEVSGVSLMDAAVMLYRLRWRVLGVAIGAWVLSTIIAQEPEPPFRWSFVVEAPTVMSTGGSVTQITSLDSLAVAAAEMSGLDAAFVKISASGKPEVLRGFLRVSQSSDSGAEAPKELLSMRSQAALALGKEVEVYVEQQTAVVQAARERAQTMAESSNVTPDARAAAELVLAQAEAATRTPPTFKVSECALMPTTQSSLRPMLLRAFGSVAFALAFVLALEGWSRVAAAARATVSR